MSTETNPIVMSPANWERYANSIDRHFAARMGTLGSSGPRLGFTALEFVGEAGELKKLWRDGPSVERLEKARMEIVDNWILLRRICRHLNVDPDQAAADKVAELHLRWPDIPRLQSDIYPLWPNYTVYGYGKENKS
jgi:hypothetical protein